MTSQKSLNNTFAFSFKTAFGENFIIPLLTFLGLMFLGPYTIFTNLKCERSNRAVMAMESNSAATELKDVYRYFFGNFAEMDIITVFGVVCASVLLGVIAFRFIANKKTVNVYYSLGIKRTKLFASKYFAGLIMQSVAVIIPSLLSIFVNIYYIGSSRELWAAGIYRGMLLLATAIFCYTFTAMIFCCVGTIVEGIIFSGVTLGLPSIALFSLQTFMSKLIWGSPYGKSVRTAEYVSLSATSLLSKFANYNPLLFAVTGLKKYLIAPIEKTVDANNQTVIKIFSGENGTVWSNPNYTAIICWLAASVAVFALGLYLYKNRKAEICGFRGMNKVLNTLVTFAVGIFAFSLATNLYDVIGFVPMIIAAIAAYVVIYLIIELVLNRSKKAFVKGLVKLPVHVGVLVIISIVIGTGLFGFSNKLPEVEEISSVSVSAPMSMKEAMGDAGFSTTRGESVFIGEVYYPVYAATVKGEYTTESDKKTMLDINKAFVELKNKKLDQNSEDCINYPIAFHYTLKNGKTVTRYYDYCNEETMKQLFLAATTDYYKEKVAEAFTTDFRILTDEEYSSEQYTPEISKLATNERYTYEGGLVTFISPDLARQTIFGTDTVLNDTRGEEGAAATENDGAEKLAYLHMSKEVHTALKQAIKQDLVAQTAQQKFNPTDSAVGIISFSSKRNSGGEISYFYGDGFSGVTAPVSSGTCIYVTPDMVNTIKVLKDNGFYEYFETTLKPVSVSVVKAGRAFEQDTDLYYSGLESNLVGEFILTRVSAETYSLLKKNDYDTTVLNKKISEKEKVEQLASLAQINYFSFTDGYYCIFEMSDGSYVTKFLPEGKTPDYVKAMF